MGLVRCSRRSPTGRVFSSNTGFALTGASPTRKQLACSRRRHASVMNSSIDKIDHMSCRLNGQGMMGEARPRRDVVCHFASKVQLPIGPFCEQHNHQVLQPRSRGHEAEQARRSSAEEPQIGQRKLSLFENLGVPHLPRCPSAKARVGAPAPGSRDLVFRQA